MGRGDFSGLKPQYGVIGAVIIAALLRLYYWRLTVTDSSILFYGYDDYYHMRRILYTVHHFPATLWFDSYLDFPNGFGLSWPPLFDLLAASLAKLTGAISQHAVEMVSAILPVILGTLAVVVVYYLVKEAFDERSAVLSALLAAIAPNSVITTSFAASDHHGLEVLLLCSLMLMLTLAIHRSSTGYAVAAGFCIAMLAYAWAGAAVYISIVLLYGLVQIFCDFKSGASSDRFIQILLVSFGSALAMMAPVWSSPWMHTTFAATFGMILILLVVWGIYRLLLGRVQWFVLPLVIAALALAALALTYSLKGSSPLAGGIFRMITDPLSYLFGGELTGLIDEGQPLLSIIKPFSFTAANLLFSVIGLAVLVRVSLHTPANRGQILFLSWTAAALLLTFGQSRFLYLYSVNMAVLIAILYFWLLDTIQKRTQAKGQDSKKNKKRQDNRKSRNSAAVPYGPVAIALLVLMLIPSIGQNVSFSDDLPVATGDWQEAMDWLKSNTPATSFYDDPKSRPEYGIMSAWDYGNLILYMGERPVVANNFQTGVISSSRFFLAENESQAWEIMDKRACRYVISDWDMIYKTMPATANWIGEDPASYIAYKPMGKYIGIELQDRLRRTVLFKLHLFDGQGMGRFRLIYESSTLYGQDPAASKVKIFEYVPGAQIMGSATPDKPVGVLLNMTTNQGRLFQYTAFAMPQSGSYEIRIPYSTERRYGTHAVDSCIVFTDTGEKRISVSEEDVLLGRVIRADLI